MDPNQHPEPAVENPFLILVADHLTATTRSHRKALLLAASVSLFLLWTGITPEIPAIGITQKLDRNQTLFVLFFLVLYFFVEFSVSWFADRSMMEYKLRTPISPNLAQLAAQINYKPRHGLRTGEDLAKQIKDFADGSLGRFGYLKLACAVAPRCLGKRFIDVWLTFAIGATAWIWLLYSLVFRDSLSAPPPPPLIFD